MKALKTRLVRLAAVLALAATPLMALAQGMAPAVKLPNAKPVVWIGDFNNFDDAVALMLIAKDPRHRIELISVEESFNAVAPGINLAYNILEWLHNLDVEIIRGAYHAVDEVRLGANGERTDPSLVARVDEGYQLPNAAENPERRNVMGINLFMQYVPGPWRDNGATLYGTEHLIPRATQPSYHYNGNRGRNGNFQMAEDILIDTINASPEKVILFSTGKLTTLARVLTETSETTGLPLNPRKVERVVVMGGGFQGLEPFTADNPATCFGDRTLNLGGNIFSHPSFGCDTDFSTHQEYNILLDPTAAKVAFDALAAGGFDTLVVPTNGTDLAKLEVATIDALEAPATRRSVPTPEALYVAEMFRQIREFEGGDDFGGDFVLDAVIRLWDVVAALLVVEPRLTGNVRADACIAVETLDDTLLAANAYDPISAQPTVGKTELIPCAANQTPPHVVLSIQVDEARQAMIDRLRAPLNAATVAPMGLGQ